MIPLYPEFAALRLEHRPLLSQALQCCPPQTSEMTFTNLFAWRRSYGFEVAALEDWFLVRSRTAAGLRYLPPLGPADPGAVIERLFADGADLFIRLPASLAERFRAEERFTVTPDRDNADYLYRMSDLADLPGRRYDGKRNHLKKFRSSCHAEYRALDAQSAGAAKAFIGSWCVLKDCDKSESLAAERAAVFEMLESAALLGIEGGVLFVKGEPEAFIVGEELNPETLVVHALKANPALGGAYQAILNEFLSRLRGRFAYVNLEQDLGVEGLRRAKESYHPLRLVEKYTLSRARLPQQE